MANFFEEYMITPSFLDKFSNLGLLGGLNNLNLNFGATGNSTTPTQYQFDNLDKPLFGDFDLGGKNAGKNTFPTKMPSKASGDFADALAGGLKDLEGGLGKIGSSFNAKKQNGYQIKPSNVNYSQFMGLSPETQRYLYGGM